MNISILGCGWLGLPLAERLLNDGHIVKGSTTRSEMIISLRNKGITPYRIKLFEEGIEGDISAFLSEADILIIDIPPGVRNNPDSNFMAKIGRLKDHIIKSSIIKVLLVSSTSVYEDRSEFPVYTEEDAPNGTAKNAVQLIGVEEMLCHNQFFITTILRFGGLIGPGRHPIHFLTGRSVKDPGAPVNLIQQQDCIEIIVSIIRSEAWGQIFNAVYPKHPSKEEYYSTAAKSKNLVPPEFENNVVSKGKIIDSRNLIDMLGFTFQHVI